jgi:hypothetical protein
MDAFPDPRLSLNHTPKPKTQAQTEYERYIRQSRRWRAMRLAVRMRAKNKC